jgi:hypothetical protein
VLSAAGAMPDKTYHSISSLFSLYLIDGHFFFMDAFMLLTVTGKILIARTTSFTGKVQYCLKALDTYYNHLPKKIYFSMVFALT